MPVTVTGRGLDDAHGVCSMQCMMHGTRIPTLVLCASFVVVTACDRGDTTTTPAPTAGAANDAQTPATTQAPPPMAALPEGATIADVAARVTPSVVTVFSERDVLPEIDPLAEMLGRRAPTGSWRERGLGSGVIVDAQEGLVITNHHVVAEADAVRVALQDGKSFEAKVVGSDAKSDIALLRMDRRGEELRAIEVADSTRSRIGDVVLAVGNPFGIGQTVTMGIISAVGRANMGLTDYEDFIQTDAAINPGNSGGALVDMAGRLVGINTAIVSQTGGAAGIGFAIPSAMVLQIKDALLRDGRVVRGWMGVALQEVDGDLSRALALGDRRGVLVTGVVADGPGAKAGLARGDLIVAVDGVPAQGAAPVRNHVALKGKGARVALDVVRRGHERRMDIVLDELPDDRSAAETADEGAREGDDHDDVLARGPLIGIVVAELDDNARRKLRLARDIDGVVITRAPRGGALRAGDVIVEVDRRPTPDLSSFRAAARNVGAEALLLLHRRGQSIFLLLSPR